MPAERGARSPAHWLAEHSLLEFARIERGPLFAWVRRSHYEAVRAAGFLAPDLSASAQSVPGRRGVAGGRGGIERIGLAGGGGAVLRKYLRGGLPGMFSRDLHLASGRARLELLLHEELARRGIPTLRVLAARTLRVGGIFFRHALLTEELDAVDLLTSLEARPDSRRQLFAAAGRAIRALHDVGFEHRDLHPRNLLVAGGGAGSSPPRRASPTPPSDRGPTVFVIDLDRGTFRTALDARARGRSLVRFARYLRRHEGATAFEPSARDELRFVRGYLGVERAGARDRRGQVEAFRKELRRRLACELFWHRLWWRLGPRSNAGA